MTGTFKSIPIQGAEHDLELRGCAEAEPFALRVIGDSMAPEFHDGHIIIVDPAMPAQSGAYVVVDYQGETTFRQYVVENGRKFLRTLDGATDVELVEAYQIRGVVVQRAGRRRKDHKHYY
jgi:SOS-response transcriptional repressor LexA